MKAIWNGVVLAESADTKVVEGNHYFPPNSIHREYCRDTDRHTTCPWKGLASYYDVVAGGETTRNAAWYYPEPKSAAAEIRDHVAFYGIVKVEK